MSLIYTINTALQNGIVKLAVSAMDMPQDCYRGGIESSGVSPNLKKCKPPVNRVVSYGFFSYKAV